MAATNIRGGQILSNTVGRSDMNTATSGSAVVTKIVQGTNVTLSSTGADSGTGDVTINATGGGATIYSGQVAVDFGPTDSGGADNDDEIATTTVSAAWVSAISYPVVSMSTGFDHLDA